MKILIEGIEILSRGYGEYIAGPGQKIIEIDAGSWPNGKRKNECKWNGTTVLSKTNSDLLSDYKNLKKQELKGLIRANWLEINKTLEQIKTKWINLQTDSVNWTTKIKVDTAYDNTVIWLGL